VKREMRLFKFAPHCTNFSRIRGEGEKLSVWHFVRLMSFLDVLDRGRRRDEVRLNHAARGQDGRARLDHPEVERFVM